MWGTKKRSKFKSLQDISQAIESYIGLKATVRDDETSGMLIFKSSKDVTLFYVRVVHIPDEGWVFASHSSALPNSWNDLNSLHLE